MSAGEKKIGEVDRLQQLMAQNSLSFQDIAEMSDASERTAKNIVYENKPLGMKLVRGLLKKTGVSIDWLLTGEGEMYRANRSASSGTTYRDNGIAVHTNNGNIGIGTQNNDSGGRGNRLCQFALWWMEKHSEDEQAWLEQQIARAVPEYAEWRKEAEK